MAQPTETNKKNLSVKMDKSNYSATKNSTFLLPTSFFAYYSSHAKIYLWKI